MWAHGHIEGSDFTLPCSNQWTSWASSPNTDAHNREIKTGRQIGLSIYQNWCMLTSLWDRPSPDISHTTWYSGTDCAYPLTFTSLWWGTWNNIGVSIAMLLSYVNDCEKPSRKHKCSPHLRLRNRSDTMTGKLIPFHLRQMAWSWLELMPTRGRGKWRTGGRRNCMNWNTKLLKESLCTSWKTSRQDAHESSTETDFFSSLWRRGLLFVWFCELSGPGAPPLP